MLTRCLSSLGDMELPKRNQARMILVPPPALNALEQVYDHPYVRGARGTLLTPCLHSRRSCGLSTPERRPRVGSKVGSA